MDREALPVEPGRISRPHSMMKIDRITLREIRMPLLFRFETSFGETTERRIVLVEVSGEGSWGWGEVTAGEGPFYNEEYTETAWRVLSEFAIPSVLASPIDSASSAWERWERIRGHHMAIGGLEAALWDWEARLTGNPLPKLLSDASQAKAEPRAEIPCGVSIGIQRTADELISRIEKELEAGYQRIKIKIKPGWDVEPLERVRERYPRLPLMADANSAYTLADRAQLKLLDRFYLMMIEQPLAHDDLIDHAKLQRYIDTPICLDESIRTLRHAEQAIELRACQIVNVKLGRVGGFWNAIRIHDCCMDARIPVWCGGMLESGIGRAHNAALSTLPNFLLPGDVAASRRYWDRDIISPEVEVTAKGTIELPADPGYRPDLVLIERLTVRKEDFHCPGK